MKNMREELSMDRLEDVAGGVLGSATTYLEYTVARGDSLLDIASKFRTTVREIMLMNPFIVNVDLIRVGWVLKVPTKMR